MARPSAACLISGGATHLVNTLRSPSLRGDLQEIIFTGAC